MSASTTIHVLNVSKSNGYGDSTIVYGESERGRVNLLFDAGYENELRAALPDPPVFEHAFLTHYHEDHYEGFINLLKENRIRHLYLPDTLWILFQPEGPTRICSKGFQRTKRLHYLFYVISSLSQFAIRELAERYGEDETVVVPLRPRWLMREKEKAEGREFEELTVGNLFHVEYACWFPHPWQGARYLSSEETEKIEKAAEKAAENSNAKFRWNSDNPMTRLFIPSLDERGVRSRIDELTRSFESLMRAIGEDPSDAPSETGARRDFSSMLRYFRTLFHKKERMRAGSKFEFIEEGLLYVCLWRDEAKSLSNLIEKTGQFSEDPKWNRLSEFVGILWSLGDYVNGYLSDFGREVMEVLQLKKERNNFGILARVTSIPSGKSLLVTGDMDIKGVCDFLDTLPVRRCEFVKASHHGSRRTHGSASVIEAMEEKTEVKEYFVPNRRANKWKSGSGKVAPCDYFCDRDCCVSCGHPHAERSDLPHVHFSADREEGIVHRF